MKSARTRPITLNLVFWMLVVQAGLCLAQMLVVAFRLDWYEVALRDFLTTQVIVLVGGTALAVLPPVISAHLVRESSRFAAIVVAVAAVLQVYRLLSRVDLLGLMATCLGIACVILSFLPKTRRYLRGLES